MNPKSLELKTMLYSTCPKHLIDYDPKDYIWNDPNVGVWIDMNEPACFELTDKTMPKSNFHTVELMNSKGAVEERLVEHRDVHSLYGYYSSQVTYHALRARSAERPFILSRSFYPGSQRYCAIWSGDSNSNWKDFENCVPILLQKAMCGISFIGGDVPGFSGDPILSDQEEKSQLVVENLRKELAEANSLVKTL